MGDQDLRVTLVGLNYWPEATGNAPYTTNLAAGLVTQGWTVRAVTGYPHYPMWRVPAEYHGLRMIENISGVSVTRLRPYVPSRPSGLRRLLMEISFGLSSVFTNWGNPQVVVLVSPALFAVAIAQIKARMLPSRPSVVVWVQDIYSLGVAETGAMGSRGARMVAKVEASILKRADRVVVIHDRFKRYLTTSLGIESAGIDVVRNWTHLRSNAVAIDREKYRAKFGWSDEIIVLHAGNMGVKQALENVVEAARLADRSGSSIRFVLLGNGNQRNHLEELAKDVTRLEFLDSLDDEDFKGALAAADILLVNEKAGVSEMAVPSKLTSYFTSGRPVLVASGADSITSEELAAAAAGVRVDAGDPASLLREALSLGLDATRAEGLGRNGMAFQARVLSEKAAISRYAALLSSLVLLGPGHSPPSADPVATAAKAVMSARRD
ncbi:glycosyltransferase WbuB [Cryobacterium sp. TMT1-21]|uniref:glycosyltransferase family 4 protein n=1 Tax=Cryobacterium sp. TMT1-21 TaxID=1259234 RepID=UPI00106ACE46|nr:glycosyltransferase family 4 protein [Cryobacterium sp. TMT1-21]TFD17283.1 glycosyltransferase WbuB [Cryobacterium sp. TMT1-21]